MSVANDPDDKLESARNRVRESGIDDASREAILRFSAAVRSPTDDDGLADRTNATYVDHLRRIAKRLDPALLDAETSDLAILFNAMSSDYAPQTVGAYQSAAKSFYTEIDGHNVDTSAIEVDSNSVDDRAIDPAKMLTEEQFFALRDAATNPRDRAIIDLLGYTGQRVRAIQTLRIGDVDPHAGDTGLYRLNTDDGGLKGADRSMARRPLLGAKRAVIDALRDHPTGENDDYLITCNPSARNGEPGTKLSQTQIRRIIQKLADRAGIDTDSTPVNPHAFRHYFATTAYRDYDMEKDTIKRLLGHSANSRTFEITYRHLDDDDVIEDAESAFGFETDRERSCPPMCPDCHAPLKDGTDHCSCGSVVSDADPEPSTLDPAEADEWIHRDEVEDKFMTEKEVKEIVADAVRSVTDDERVQRDAIGTVKSKTDPDGGPENTAAGPFVHDDTSDS